MQEKRVIGRKKLARTPSYSSPSQLTLAGFETPFERTLNPNNRWVRLAHLIPWDRIVPIYDCCFSSKEGRPPINGRVVIGALIIKHMEMLSDRATLDHISENLYMQYFLGYSSFTNEVPFTAPLFVSLRKRVSPELTNEISELIATLAGEEDDSFGEPPAPDSSEEEAVTESSFSLEQSKDSQQNEQSQQDEQSEEKKTAEPAPRGKLLMDATVAPQDITFPTDIKLLDSARRKSEELIDILCRSGLHGDKKPRTYRRVARQMFLNIQKKKIRSAKHVRRAIGQQLRFLRRNLKHIEILLSACESSPLKPSNQKYLQVLHTVYEQQEAMYRNHTHKIADRIVSIHQPHVRPMVRGKDRQNVEFGSKLQVSLVNGFTFIDKLSWDAFNEGQYLKESVERYRLRRGYYPAEVLADKIYCTRENRRWLKAHGIKLAAKPLGRPSAQAVKYHVSPGERNPIEGKFGQAKLAYGLNNIRARLKETSESWIACIALVLNLVRLAGQAPYCPIRFMQSLVDKILTFWYTSILKYRTCSVI